MSNAPLAEAPRVFLSYAHNDRRLAQHISEALARAGVRVVNEDWENVARQDWATLVQETIRTSDIVVVLLTPSVVASRGVGAEIDFTLSRDLDQRGAVLIPVMAAPTDPPQALRNRAMVDLTEDLDAGVRRLVEQIQATWRADFSAMNPRAFEHLVADLLQASGFHLAEVPPSSDLGVNLVATYQRTDPSGSLQTERWLVEIKLYSHQRVSVDAIKQLAAYLSRAPGGTHGLLVTNAQLTSVARDYAEELEQGLTGRLWLLDGLDLQRLVRQFPAVATQHFGDTATSTGGPRGDS